MESCFLTRIPIWKNKKVKDEDEDGLQLSVYIYLAILAAGAFSVETTYLTQPPRRWKFSHVQIEHSGKKIRGRPHPIRRLDKRIRKKKNSEFCLAQNWYSKNRFKYRTQISDQFFSPVHTE